MSLLEELVLRNTTNEALPEVRKRELYALISKIQGEILSFDTEIENLRLKRRMKMATLMELKAIISPVKELPNEIIAKIFVHYMTRKSKSDRGAEVMQPPWCLGQICSRWRGVALSTSELWTDIAIQIPTVELIQSSLEQSADLFSRAGNSPVNLIIHQSDSSTSATCLLPLFAQSAASIRRLVFYKLNWNLQPVHEQQPGGSLEHLETLDIYFGSKNGRDRSSLDVKPQMTIFGDFPSLRRVSITTEWWMRPGYFGFPLLNIPWSQLTHLHIFTAYPLPFFSTYQLLHQCNRLVVCSFCIPDDHEDRGNFPVVALRDLETWTIRTIKPGIYGAFLRHFLTPSLRGLSFSLMDNNINDGWSSAAVVGLITRSACPIEALQVLEVIPEDVLLALLEATPHLKRLSIGETSLLCRVLPRIAKGIFLCNLQVLECGVHRLSYVNELNKSLRENGFGPRSQAFRATLTIILVPKRREPTADEVQQIRILERNWLRVGFRRRVDEHFMDYPLGEITKIEYEFE